MCVHTCGQVTGFHISTKHLEEKNNQLQAYTQITHNKHARSHTPRTRAHTHIYAHTQENIQVYLSTSRHVTPWPNSWQHSYYYYAHVNTHNTYTHAHTQHWHTIAHTRTPHASYFLRAYLTAILLFSSQYVKLTRLLSTANSPSFADLVTLFIREIRCSVRLQNSASVRSTRGFLPAAALPYASLEYF